MRADRTRHPIGEEMMMQTMDKGIRRLPDGRLKIETTAKCARTGRLKKVRMTLPEGTSLAQAALMRDQMKEEIKGGAPDAAPARTTVGDYAVSWLASKAPRLKPRTLSTYEDLLATRILPELGDIYVDALTRQDVLRWVAWAESARRADGRRFGDATVKSWWRVLSMLLRDAAADLDIADPTVRVRPPATHERGRQERATLTRDQLAALLVSVQRRAPGRYAEAVTLAYTGLRAGELYALHWPDVDLASGVLTVRHALSGKVLTDTKTHAPRQVYAPPTVVSALTSHRRAQLAAQHPGLASGLVFPADGGGYREGCALVRVLTLAAADAGITQHVTPQVLRRTYNTLLVAAGVDRIVLRAQMGHTSEAMTQRYAGVGVDQKRAAVERLFAGPVDT